MEPDDPGPPSEEEQLDAFEQFLLGWGRSAATVKRYKGIMRQHFRGEPENDVTRKALSAWTRFLEDRWVGGELRQLVHSSYRAGCGRCRVVLELSIEELYSRLPPQVSSSWSSQRVCLLSRFTSCLRFGPRRCRTWKRSSTSTCAARRVLPDRTRSASMGKSFRVHAPVISDRQPLEVIATLISLRLSQPMISWSVVRSTTDCVAPLFYAWQECVQ